MHVEAQIHTSAAQVVMSHHVTDRLDADAPPQKTHRKAVSKTVRRVVSNIELALTETLLKQQRDSLPLQGDAGTREA